LSFSKVSEEAVPLSLSGSSPINELSSNNESEADVPVADADAVFFEADVDALDVVELLPDVFLFDAEDDPDEPVFEDPPDLPEDEADPDAEFEAVDVISYVLVRSVVGSL
jgi:hypothetical protein